MSARVLYWFSGSPPCWRVMAVLKEKRLQYQSKRLDLSKGELKSAEVMALNPRGQAPTFKDGDIVVNDSMAVMQYLEETYPEVPLLPIGRADRALALQRLHEAATLLPAIQPLFYAKLAGQVNTDLEQEQFMASAEKAHKELAFFEGYLSDGREFLAGGAFTLADINLAVTLFFAQQYGATLAQYPRLLEYGGRLAERPCVKDTWPPHWLVAERKDWLVDL